MVCSESGEDALEKAMALSVDLILLDLMLPGMDGMDDVSTGNRELALCG